MIAHRETHPGWHGQHGHRMLTALLMALLLLLLYALVHAAAASIIDVPPDYMSVGGFVVALVCLLFALAAPTLRGAWTRLSLAAGTIAVVLGALALAAATWSDGSKPPLPIEIPWSLQASWGSVLHSAVIAIAIVALGLTLLVVAYGLHRKSGRDDVLPRDHGARKAGG